MEINGDSVKTVANFFMLTGYKSFADEIKDAWEGYTKSVLSLARVDYGYFEKDVSVFDGNVTACMEDYKTSLQKLKEVFGCYVRKAAVMIEGAKWRRCSL